VRRPRSRGQRIPQTSATAISRAFMIASPAAGRSVFMASARAARRWSTPRTPGARQDRLGPDTAGRNPGHPTAALTTCSGSAASRTRRLRRRSASRTESTVAAPVGSGGHAVGSAIMKSLPWSLPHTRHPRDGRLAGVGESGDVRDPTDAPVVHGSVGAQAFRA